MTLLIVVVAVCPLAAQGEDLTITKEFLGDPVAPGSLAILRFTVDTNKACLLSGGIEDIAFTDDLDATLSGLVAVGLPQNDICGIGSQITGTGFLELTNGSLALRSGGCQFDVVVQVPPGAADGDYLNTTSTVTATCDGAPIQGSPAEDTLTLDSFLGPEIEVSPTALDFLFVRELGSKGLELAVENIGGATINVTSIALCAGTSTVFSWSPPGPFSVPPAGSETLTVVYAPVDLGEDSGCLEITSNDADDSPLEVPLTGTGVTCNPTVVITTDLNQSEPIIACDEITVDAADVWLGTLVAGESVTFNPDAAAQEMTVMIDPVLAGCLIDAECDDGLFCNGLETCVLGLCEAGAPPCSVCDEPTDQCGSRVFVSSASYDGDFDGAGAFSGRQKADAECKALADAAGLGGEWKAYLSTSSPNNEARDRLDEGVFQLVDGTSIASSIADLTDGSIANPISLDETGSAVTALLTAWTGTANTGESTSPNDCFDWKNDTDSFQGTIGAVDSSTLWSDMGGPNSPVICNTSHRIYCFEDIP